jgi:hypothetical protein
VSLSAELAAGRGVAEAFARAYFTWGNDVEKRRSALASLVTDALSPDAGFTPPAGGSQTVVWTTVISERTDGKTRYVTVAVDTGKAGMAYLEVPVERRDGRIAVIDYPAVVGAPPRLADVPRPGVEPVEDSELSAIARRAVTNYLKGEADDLRADLARGAVVTLPELRVGSPRPLVVTWLDRTTGWVAVAVELPGGPRLVYRLAVVKSERWYVRAINTNP